MMTDLRRDSDLPGLLVSVRDVEEALAALSAGADVIDVKEPRRGSLGAADAAMTAAIVRAVAGRTPVTAAVGELSEHADGIRSACLPQIPPGVSLFKLGLARCGLMVNWQARWLEVTAAVRGMAPNLMPHPVAVVYADWRRADAPTPEKILSAAVEAGSPALLVDTCDKSGGGLFDHWPADDLRRFVQRVRAHDIVAVLAGSLCGDTFATAVRLAPDLVAVRTAACDAGRDGEVSAGRVRALKQVIAGMRFE
jgi:uncharacterized protein (UPF0264 family)